MAQRKKQTPIKPEQQDCLRKAKAFALILGAITNFAKTVGAILKEWLDH